MEKENIDPLEISLKGEKIKTRIETKRGSFEISLPLPRDLRKIELLVAQRLEGENINSFSLQIDI